MINLEVKTKNNFSPRGKAKVYFCAHPQDFMYLNEICADIFKTQDCAVYYKKDPEAAFEDTDFLAFEEISLVVAPITARFLSDEKSSFNAEFAFLKEMNVPVLPLMQESGLETAFNACAKCKNMQFLDKHKKDSTEIPFEEKLQKFLAAVLIGDELAEQIRAEFDGYIFLSYRKKDRKHALDVMKLIHKGDEFRDIAIWYDEYLKPGEDFNDEIKGALKKSDLFTLAVTPNILEKDNYVIKNEYPEAKKLGKKVFSAEALPTDRYALKQVFDGLDEPKNIQDEAAFHKALSCALSNVARKANDTDPKHNYLIGLAYFSGVDVETDKKRGFQIICECASAGYAPAMEKLASIYRYGESVKRDFKKAIDWQSAAVKARKKEWETLVSTVGQTNAWTDELLETSDNLYTATDLLGDYALESGDLETAVPAYQEAVAFQERARERYGRFSNLYVYVFSRKKLGDAYRWAGKLIEAKAEYDKTIRFLKTIVEKTGDADCALELVGAYEEAGQICLLLGEAHAARGYFESSISAAEKLDDGDANSAVTLASRYAVMSASAFEFGEYSVALAYLKKALRIRLDVAEQSEEFEDWVRVAELYVSFGQIYSMTAEHEKAEESCKKAVDLFERYAREDGGVWSKGALSMAYSFLGLALADRGETDSALGYLEKAWGISARALRETGLERFRSDTARAALGIGEIRRMQGKTDEAKEKVLEVLSLIDSLPDGVAMTGELRMLSALANNSAWMMALEDGDEENGETYYRAVKKIVDEWDETSFEEMATRDAVGFCACCNGLAKASMDEGDTVRADGYYQKTVAAFLQFDKRGGAAALATFAMQAYAGIAWMANSAGDTSRAKEYFEKAFALGKNVPEPDPIACRFLALAAVGIGDSLKDTNGREAKKYYEQALSYCELPAVKDEVQDIAAILSRYLAVICASIGETDEAISRFRVILDEKWGEYYAYEMMLSMMTDDEDGVSYEDETQEFLQKSLESLAVIADCYIGIFGVDASALEEDKERIESAFETLSQFVEMGVTDETVALYVTYLQQILMILG